jgi:hypothetical protein
LVLFEPVVFEERDSIRYKPLAKVRRGVVAWSVSHGGGRLIVVGAPSPALNWMIDQGGNLNFLLAVIGKQPVIFDEWSHGFGNPGTVMGVVREFGLVPVIVQVFFVIALYTWSSSGRRRVDRADVARRRSSAEQIETLGYLYAQTYSGKQACRQVSGEVRRRLAGAMRCAAGDVDHQLARVKPQAAEQIRELLAMLGEAEQLAERERRGRTDRRLARILAQSHHLASGELL